ncbi:hypothetical protein QJS10_CPA09g00505 [Acorus calamus]|uniref:Uncharacterized protein n=1 Tax=Acorus calamus TaxID=4465 RepID=A0AAV9E9T1_ACOCL|nr:hypothetical protein QJS10_CPA09g00505 [Acorus calamus]
MSMIRSSSAQPELVSSTVQSARDELNKLKEEMQEALTRLRMYEPVIEEIKSREDAESTAEFIRGLLHKVRERKQQSMERGLMKLSIYEQGESSASGSRMNQGNTIHQFLSKIMCNLKWCRATTKHICHIGSTHKMLRGRTIIMSVKWKHPSELQV